MIIPSCYDLLARCFAAPKSHWDSVLEGQGGNGTTCETLTISKQCNNINQNAPKKITSWAEYKVDWMGTSFLSGEP